MKCKNSASKGNATVDSDVDELKGNSLEVVTMDEPDVKIVQIALNNVTPEENEYKSKEKGRASQKMKLVHMKRGTKVMWPGLRNMRHLKSKYDINADWYGRITELVLVRIKRNKQ